MKNLYLHIGCGKTGTSALQVWLNQNARVLSDLGYFYPQTEGEVVNPYQITSGNGEAAYNAIQAGEGRLYLSNLFATAKKHIIISSELFQLLDRAQISEVRSIFSDLNLNPVIIVYVRDLYDILNSTYHQFVKRHLFTLSFREFVMDLQSVQQFDVLDNWMSVFGELVVMHYDVERGSIDQSFLKAINISNGLVPKIKPNTVNRSLTPFELELLRFLNALYVNKFGVVDELFSMVISDELIKLYPEKKSAILYDPDVEVYLLDKFGKKIADINSKYFPNGPGLAVFRPEGKNIIYSEVNLDELYKSVISVLFAMIEAIDIFGKQLPVAASAGPLNIADPRIVDVLRNQAISFESDDISKAFALMKAAQILRPTGPVINQKIAEYQQILEQEKS